MENINDVALFELTEAEVNFVNGGYAVFFRLLTATGYH